MLICWLFGLIRLFLCEEYNVGARSEIERSCLLPAARTWWKHSPNNIKTSSEEWSVKLVGTRIDWRFVLIQSHTITYTHTHAYTHARTRLSSHKHSHAHPLFTYVCMHVILMTYNSASALYFNDACFAFLHESLNEIIWLHLKIIKMKLSFLL